MDKGRVHHKQERVVPVLIRKLERLPGYPVLIMEHHVPAEGVGLRVVVPQGLGEVVTPA